MRRPYYDANERPLTTRQWPLVSLVVRASGAVTLGAHASGAPKTRTC
ncbi:hypothetical protein [Chloroflexus sp.]|nr:hypothetical protein [Chloroflexus sp.]